MARSGELGVLRDGKLGLRMKLGLRDKLGWRIGDRAGWRAKLGWRIGERAKLGLLRIKAKEEPKEAKERGLPAPAAVGSTWATADGGEATTVGDTSLSPSPLTITLSSHSICRWRAAPLLMPLLLSSLSSEHVEDVPETDVSGCLHGSEADDVSETDVLGSCCLHGSKAVAESVSYLLRGVDSSGIDASVGDSSDSDDAIESGVYNCSILTSQSPSLLLESLAAAGSYNAAVTCMPPPVQDFVVVCDSQSSRSGDKVDMRAERHLCNARASMMADARYNVTATQSTTDPALSGDLARPLPSLNRRHHAATAVASTMDLLCRQAASRAVVSTCRMCGHIYVAVARRPLNFCRFLGMGYGR